jgi:hypothetical protein
MCESKEKSSLSRPVFFFKNKKEREAVHRFLHFDLSLFGVYLRRGKEEFSPLFSTIFGGDFSVYLN